MYQYVCVEGGGGMFNFLFCNKTIFLSKSNRNFWLRDFVLQNTIEINTFQKSRSFCQNFQ